MVAWFLILKQYRPMGHCLGSGTWLPRGSRVLGSAEPFACSCSAAFPLRLRSRSLLPFDSSGAPTNVARSPAHAGRVRARGVKRGFAGTVERDALTRVTRNCDRETSWCAQRESNPQPHGPKPCTLSIELWARARNVARAFFHRKKHKAYLDMKGILR